MAAEVGEGFGEVDFVEVDLGCFVSAVFFQYNQTNSCWWIACVCVCVCAIRLEGVSSYTYINVEKTLEVFVWVRDEVLSVGAENAAVAVVDVRVFQVLARWGVYFDSLGGDGLPGG